VVNIWTPTNATPKSKLPVLVFIHGGAFYVGSGLDNYANPHNLTQNDVIFVNINYRLGYLGFLAHPALTRENPSKPCNFGLLDQRVALDWVSKHIGAFGGDSNNITMMGESAGAVSVMAHLAAVDVYNPPVSKAVVMSSIPWFTRANLSHAEELGIDMVKRFGCSQETDEELLKCLRSLPTEEFLIMASLRLVFFWHLSTGPALIHDGINFKEPNVGSFMEGNFKHDIPLMIGTTADEGNLFVFLSFILHKPTEDIYKSLVEKAFGRFSETVPGVVNEIFERYSLSSPKYATYPAFYALGDIISDVSFTCPSQQMLKSAHSFSSSKHANGHKNVYGYLWNYNHDPSDVMRAYHGSELPYFFGGGDRTQPDSVKLGNHIFPYLLQFVRTGSPSVPNLPEWPSFGDEHNVLVLQPNVTVQTHFKDEICQWWHTNFPKGMPMSTDDLLADEPFLSMFFNKYVLYAIITFNRKPRLAYSVTGVVLLLFGLILYKIVKAICCRSKKPVATKQKKQQ
jgi:para-nitrobenzyl esterase